jgi:hypothetical protein
MGAAFRLLHNLGDGFHAPAAAGPGPAGLPYLTDCARAVFNGFSDPLIVYALAMANKHGFCCFRRAWP